MAQVTSEGLAILGWALKTAERFYKVSRKGKKDRKNHETTPGIHTGVGHPAFLIVAGLTNKDNSHIRTVHGNLLCFILLRHAKAQNLHPLANSA